MVRYAEHKPHEVDCLILGGGITGAGVARDAAMRGLSTLLIDANDFASGTSHVTSKLIHGGFRYLEHCHFRLVLEGIVERERLLTRIAPHLLRPLRFVLPFRTAQFPKWLLAVAVVHLYGLMQWIHSGRRSSAYFGNQLRSRYPLFRGPSLGISFWDAQTNDARLVLSVLRSAQAYGSTNLNYTTMTRASFDGTAWNVELQEEGSAWPHSVRAKTLVNATGPWSPLTAELLGCPPTETMWIKGSHILLRRPAAFGDDAIIIRSVRDGRALWAVPWENRLMVGSTESRYTGDLRNVRPTTDEVADLFDSLVDAFPGLGLTRDDIRCAYAGVRPIVSQASCNENELSRRHRVRVESATRLITVSGGKLTTFRRMAEEAVDELDRLLRRPAASRSVRRRLRGDPIWPAGSEGLTDDSRATLLQKAVTFGIEDQVVEHLFRAYGAHAERILDEIVRRPDWGRSVAEGLPYCMAELAYLCCTERVCHLLDLVKRRTPLYFLLNECGLPSLSEWVAELAPVLGWDLDRCRLELASVVKEWNSDLAAIGLRAAVPALHPAQVVCA